MVKFLNIENLLRNLSRVFIVTILFMIPIVKGRSQIVTDTSLAVTLARAYSTLHIDPVQSKRLFERAVKMDPSNATTRKQLGFLYHSDKEYEKALYEFQISDSLNPSDKTKLQIAFTLLALGRSNDAESILTPLQASSIPTVSQDAKNQLASLLRSRATSDFWTRIYIAPYYDTRWQTSFIQANIQEGYNITKDKLLSGFGFVSYSGDARSSGGLAPAIFSDNAVVLGLGIKLNPFRGFQFNVQEGIAYDLIERRTRDRVNGDFRAVAIYGNGIYPSFNLHDDIQIPLSPLLDIYSSVGYYSRYKNIIGYAQGRAGVRVFEVSNTVADVFLKGGLVRDSEKEYYNNQLEGAIGFRLIPNTNWGLYVVGEFHRGYYWDVGTIRNPYDRFYSSFRFFIIFDRTF